METSLSTPAGRTEDSSSQKRARFSTALRWLNRERLDHICEKGILWTVLAILVFAPLATGSTTTYAFLTLLGLGFIVAVFWLIRLFIRTQYRFLLAPFCYVVVAFAGYAIFLYSRADIEYYARQELLRALFYAFLFFAIIDNLSSQDTIQLLLFTLIGVAVFESFYAIYQYFTGSKHVLWFAKPMIYKGRGSGTYISPNHLAGFLEMVLPVALAYTLTSRLKHLTKVFLGYAAFIIVAGIGVTISRGGYLATAFSMGLFFLLLLLRRDFRIPSLALLILLLAAGSFFGYRSYKAQFRMQATKEEHQITRKMYWAPAVAMWKENPWFGVGPNHYDWRFRKWRNNIVQNRPVYAHNDYLNTVADYGVIGAGLVAAGIGFLFWGVLKTWKYVRRANEIAAKPSNRSAILLGAAVGVVAIMTHSLGDFNMHIPANAITAVTLIAILTSHLRFATERYWVNPGIFGRMLFALIIVITGTYFTLQIITVGKATYYAKKSEQPLTFSNRLQVLKTSFAIDPKDPDVARQIGEVLRRKAWEGNEGYELLLQDALQWLQKSMQLNPWDPYNYAYAGMCYSWLGETDKSSECFEKAKSMDPESYYMLALYGWHRLQVGDLEGAKAYFLRSIGYNGWSNNNNELAKSYLELVNRRLAEQQASPLQSLK